MKKFACGDVVPGCEEEWTEPSEEALFAAIAVHAREVHGLTELPPELVDQVRNHILTVA